MRQSEIIKKYLSLDWCVRNRTAPIAFIDGESPVLVMALSEPELEQPLKDMLADKLSGTIAKIEVNIVSLEDIKKWLAECTEELNPASILISNKANKDSAALSSTEVVRKPDGSQAKREEEDDIVTKNAGDKYINIVERIAVMGMDPVEAVLGARDLKKAEKIMFKDKYDRVKKDYTTALLLCIFLGGLGGHWFYLGKTNRAILHLVFCWTYIPSIISLVQAFNIKRHVHDANIAQAREVIRDLELLASI